MLSIFLRGLLVMHSIRCLQNLETLQELFKGRQEKSLLTMAALSVSILLYEEDHIHWSWSLNSGKLVPETPRKLKRLSQEHFKQYRKMEKSSLKVLEREMKDFLPKWLWRPRGEEMRI